MKYLTYLLSALISLICLSLSGESSAQEIQAKVTVNTPKLNRTDPALFRDLERDLNNFFNTQVFSNVEYETEERIKTTIILTIRDEIGGQTFTADLIVQAVRPVFNSSYETMLINYVDQDVRFEYAPGAILQFAESAYINNLSSIMSYWALVIIGLDYDSYKPLGGTEFYTKAQNLLNAVPNNVAEAVGGWRSIESDRNRYWLVENLLNPKMEDYRLGMYRYHRNGLDIMHQNTAAGQQAVLNSIRIVKDAAKDYPNNMLVQMFSIAKSKEIINIMARANRTAQRETYELMSTIDPASRNEMSQLQ